LTAYPKCRRTTPPQVRFPPLADDDQPTRDRQSTLEPEPFLDSLPVYATRDRLEVRQLCGLFVTFTPVD